MEPLDLRARLPEILSRAIAWAGSTAAAGASQGAVLTGPGISLAQKVGVKRPELIRVVAVDKIPQPEDPLLLEAAAQVGFLNGTGLTLGYTVFLCRNDRRLTLLAHECRHVAQYEAHGSIAAFLEVYLDQLSSVGYDNAPLEIDAVAHEKHAA